MRDKRLTIHNSRNIDYLFIQGSIETIQFNEFFYLTSDLPDVIYTVTSLKYCIFTEKILDVQQKYILS